MELNLQYNTVGNDCLFGEKMAQNIFNDEIVDCSLFEYVQRALLID